MKTTLRVMVAIVALVALTLLLAPGKPSSAGTAMAVQGESQMGVHGQAEPVIASLEEAARSHPEVSDEDMGDDEPPIPLSYPLPEGLTPPGPSMHCTLSASPERRVEKGVSTEAAVGFSGGGDDGTTTPADTQGAVGPNHVLSAMNDEVLIKNRQGFPVTNMTLAQFFGPLHVTRVFDPKTFYDPYANHWVLVALIDDKLPTSAIVMAVSFNSDPTGQWIYYKMPPAQPGLWSDYPSIGFTANWITINVNMYDLNLHYQHSTTFAINKVGPYSQGSMTWTSFDDQVAVLCPALNYDAAVTTQYLVSDFNGESGYLRISMIDGPPDSPRFTPLVDYAQLIDFWHSRPAVVDPAPQLGSSAGIAAGDARMLKVVYRHGYLWTSQTVFPTTGGGSQAQFVQMTPAGRIVQFGRVFKADGYIAFPSLAVNKNDDVMMGYAVFSPTFYPSGAFSFRGGQDAPGSFRAGIPSLIAGEAPYNRTLGGPSNRWGDYSNTVVDPVDDIGMWTIQEYSRRTTTPPDAWATWWEGYNVQQASGQLQDPVLIVSFSPSTVTVGQNTTLTFTIINPNPVPFTEVSFQFGWHTGALIPLQFPTTPCGLYSSVPWASVPGTPPSLAGNGYIWSNIAVPPFGGTGTCTNFSASVVLQAGSTPGTYSVGAGPLYCAEKNCQGVWPSGTLQIVPGTSGGTPSLSNVSARLSGDVVTVNGTATDTGGDMTTVQIDILDSSSTYLAGQAFGYPFGTASSASFQQSESGLTRHLTATKASVVVTDRQGHVSPAVTADFSHGDNGGPNLDVVNYDTSSGVMLIKGGTFGLGPMSLELNGAIVSVPIKVKGGGSKVKIPGPPLLPGPNRVVLIQGGLRSNLVIYYN